MNRSPEPKATQRAAAMRVATTSPSADGRQHEAPPTSGTKGDAVSSRQENVKPLGAHMVTRKARRKSSSRGWAPKDAIALLKADHKEVKTMVGQFNKSRSDSKQAQLARRICAALEVHADRGGDFLSSRARSTEKEWRSY
jgi:hypothetical protein